MLLLLLFLLNTKKTKATKTKLSVEDGKTVSASLNSKLSWKHSVPLESRSKELLLLRMVKLLLEMVKLLLEMVITKWKVVMIMMVKLVPPPKDKLLLKEMVPKKLPQLL